MRTIFLKLNYLYKLYFFAINLDKSDRKQTNKFIETAVGYYLC